MTDVLYQTALALFGQGRATEGFDALSRGAQAGHVPSMSMLGAQLLTGQGVAYDPVEGARLILRAAEGGNGFACALAAVLFARGCSGSPDWPRALDYLQRAAERRYQPARDQLRLLSGDRSGFDWEKLRAAVDIDAWRQPPAPFTLSEAPLIQTAPGLLSPELCDALIARARPLQRPAQIYDERKGGNTAGDIRKHSTSPLFQYTDMDLVSEAVSARACALAGLPSTHAEALQVLHYRVGEYFGPHVDFWNPAFEGHAGTLKTVGQRVATVLVYLNDDLQGGETEFVRLGIQHRGAKGDALMFRNVDAQGQPDPRTLHAGRPPTAGEKWLLSVWILDRPVPDSRNPALMAAMAGG
ncbi:MAG: 2OG-Fe(II) oxygenase [Phenylobacterium sp.]